MKLSQDALEVIEDLSAQHIKALKQVSELVNEYMANEVLKSSIGRGEPADEKQLVYAKVRLEGSLKAFDLLFRQLQEIRKAADNRLVP